MIKKATSLFVVIAAVMGCFTITAFAMYGRVISNSSISSTNHGSYYTINGKGSAQEVIADKDDVMNIYAKTVIVDPSEYILSKAETTNHYTRQAYSNCSATVDDSDLQTGTYYVSTLAATRYTDNTTRNNVSKIGKELLVATRGMQGTESSSETENEYFHVTLERLCGSENYSRSAIPMDILLEIYGKHFAEADVGDKIPQLYLKNDSSMCYVIDENDTDGVVKSYYAIENGGYSEIK